MILSNSARVTFSRAAWSILDCAQHSHPPNHWHTFFTCHTLRLLRNRFPGTCHELWRGVFQFSPLLPQGSSQTVLPCAHWTSTVLLCAFCEQEGWSGCSLPILFQHPAKSGVAACGRSAAAAAAIGWSVTETGEADGDGGAFARGAADGNRAAMFFDDLFDRGKT
jgi:hypothetical protein